MLTLVQLLQNNEDWLMQRVLEYARNYGFTAYTSTLLEAWRLSISGLTASIIAVDAKEELPVIMADEPIASHPLTQFGLIEARKHQERGVSLTMFFGLLKYYRQAYTDLLDLKAAEMADYASSRLFFNRLFDVIEAGIIVGWAEGGNDQAVFRMQLKNREITNEKNKYLTIFESIPNPSFLLSPDGDVDSMNYAAAQLLNTGSVSGGDYYRSLAPADKGTNRVPPITGLQDRSFREIFPWLALEIDEFFQKELKASVFEKEIVIQEKRYIFRIKIAQMLDVSRKFDGLVLILEDITSLKDAQEKVRTLEGFIPICSHCKKMRDDDGYWSRLEEYLEKRSGAMFTHSVCDECLHTYYKDLI